VTKESKGKAQPDYTKFLTPDGLKGKVIGIDKKKSENQYLNQLLEQAVSLMKQQGATIIEIEYVDKVNKHGDAEFEVLKYEFKYGYQQIPVHGQQPNKNIERPDRIQQNK
jgi:amidase